MSEVVPSTTTINVADDSSRESFSVPAATVSVIAVRVAVARSQRRRRRRTFTDGPFTESKELIGAYRPPNASRR